MKTNYHRINRFSAFALVSLLSLPVYAATPTIQVSKPASVVVGESVLFHADVADADGNLQSAVFYVAGPGISGWQTLATLPVSGSTASPEASWTPGTAGIYTLRVDVVDPTTGSSAQATFEAFAERRILSGLTVESGANLMISSPGEIITKNDTTALSTQAKSGSNFILWSGGRITLKPGFKAESGSSFWAAVDHNMNGYSDMEEATDTDGDGMFDAWEVDHGLNMLVNDAAGDLDGDGTSNLTEFLTGRDPNNKADAKTLPTGFDLVLRLPGGTYAAVKKSDWVLTTVTAP